MLHLIYFLLIGLAAGWLASRFMGIRALALWECLLVGVVGAILGGFLFGLLGLVAIGLLGTLVTATVGAAVLLFLLQKLKQRR
jgi:uncharacterized membrane protein YeaQ/YmgE (transglycosylase-associated protein family)